MRYYPVFLDLKDRRCLVVGHGELADQKADTLTRAGAVVLRQPAFVPDEAGDVFLIVTIVDDRQEGERLKAFADHHRILLNVVDRPESCSFIAPAIVERGDLLIAISTSGKSPALARQLRRQLEEQFGFEYALLLEALGEIRPLVRERFQSFEERKSLYQRLLQKDLLETLRRGGPEALKQRIEEIVLSEPVGSQK